MKPPVPYNPYARKRENEEEVTPNISDFPALASPIKAPFPDALSVPAPQKVSLEEVHDGNFQSIDNEYVSSKPSGDLEYWERLPSRNLSFGSAEVLTVDECIKHASVYKNRAVRVTGILKDRHWKEERVVLELIHPVPNKQLKKRVRALRPSSFLQQKRKRPWFSTMATNNSKAVETVPKTLNVIAEPTMEELSKLVVGSFVMVIGFMSDSGNIQARLLQHIQRMDMNFYTNALKARRKRIYHRIEEKEDGQMLQGCGPPPYDALQGGFQQP